MTLDGRAVRMHLEIEIACENFDRTLPGAMDGHVWRVHPTWRGESERYARNAAKQARDNARSTHDGDFWSPEDDQQAKRYVGEMKTLEAMQRALEAMQRALESMQRTERMKTKLLHEAHYVEDVTSIKDTGMALVVIKKRLTKPANFVVFKFKGNGIEE